MSGDPSTGAGVSAPSLGGLGESSPPASTWYRVVAVPDIYYGGSQDRDYASVLPAALDAAQNRRAFVIGWLSSGGGAPLELITNAAPLPTWRERQHPYGAPSGELGVLGSGRPGLPGRPEYCELLFPWGARGVP